MDNLTQAAHVLTASAPRLPIAFAVAHGSEWTRFASEQQLENMGFALEDLESTALTSLVHDADRLELSRWLDSAPNESFVCRLNVPGSDERWVEMWIEQFPEGTPGNASALLVLIDITATLQLEASNSQLRAELETQLQRVMSVLNAARDGIAMWRVQRSEGGTIETFRLEFINESGAAATMRSAAELEGLDFEGVLGGDTFVELKGLFAKAIDTQQIQTSIVDVVSVRGCDGTFENRVVPISHDRVVASFRDISEERREQNRLTWLAEHDHLTGAPNRVALERLLRETLQGARDRNRAAGFVFIDIDDFKNVNDRFGHEAGDKLLVHFVQRLQNAVGSHGEIARIAGDEFAIVLRNVQSMEQFDEVMRAVFQSMQRPFDYLSSDMFITVSAGGVLTRGHEDAFEVMRIADRVMYRVKHEGKNGFQLVDTAEL